MKNGCPTSRIDREQVYWYCSVKNAMVDKSRKNDYDRLYKERTLKDTVNLVKSIN